MKKTAFCFILVLLGLKSYQQDTISLKVEIGNKIENAIKQAFFNYRRNAIPLEFRGSIGFYREEINFSQKEIYSASFDIKPCISFSNKYKFEDFYIVQKKDELIYHPGSFKIDSMALEKYTKYYPFDTKYLVFYDPHKEEGPWILSGQCEISYFLRQTNEKHAQYFRTEAITLFRLYSFGVTELDQIHLLQTNGKDNFEWAYLDSCSLSFGRPSIVKIPIFNPLFIDTQFDGVELIFFTDTIPSALYLTSINIENQHKDSLENNLEYETPASPPFPFEKRNVYEVKYIIKNRPKFFEESLVPHFRKLPENEKEQLIELLTNEKKPLRHFFIDSKTLYEKMSPYHLLPEK